MINSTLKSDNNFYILNYKYYYPKKTIKYHNQLF